MELLMKHKYHKMKTDLILKFFHTSDTLHFLSFNFQVEESCGIIVSHRGKFNASAALVEIRS